MASSRKSKRSNAQHALEAHVSGRLKSVVQPGDRLLLGLSGGIDSICLLEVLSRLRKSLRFELRALHVNHRLSPHASQWAAFCRAACRVRAVPCRVVNVEVAGGNSVERAARDARYAALRRQRAEYIVLAHNRDDQAETVLLQLLRGAGVKGLSAMPFVRKNDASAARPRLAGDTAILRPFIDVPRSHIERYARHRKLDWVDDESNNDTRYTRNWLRHDLIPRIAERVPAYRMTLTRAASNLSEAAGLLDELAGIDAAAVGNTLRTDVLRLMSPARAKNLLRYFISRRGWSMPGSERLNEALRQALVAKADAEVIVDLGACELRRHGNELHLLPKTPAPAKQVRVTWRGETELQLPGWGTLKMSRRRGKGLSAARLEDAAVTIRSREGGERLQPAHDRPRRTVKNLLQEARVPPWERERLPYIFCGESLACIPGLAVDCRFQARQGEPSILPSWKAL